MPKGFGPIPGLQVGHAQQKRALTGCTVLLAPEGMVGACEILGGAVGERDLEVLRPGHLAQRAHALLLAGGSAFGLDAAGGVMRWCAEQGLGFDTGVARVPIVPAAILFDLRIGSSERRPDAAMGYAAARDASSAPAGAPVAEGNVGAGAGCTVGKLFGIARAMKAGIGCWTELLPGGVRVAALAAVNAFGDVRDPSTGQILAGARRGETSREFVDMAAAMRTGAKRGSFADPNTVLVAVATDAALTRVEASQLARVAAAGMARTLSPAHTTFDGDVVFALSLGSAEADRNALGIAAAEAVARAIVRGVTQARSAGGVPGLAG
jgi:L-aminopeptidase/D-esterase-like protein